jgi:uncharacterized protein (DUF305 family)
MAGMKGMHDKMMAAERSDPDKAFAKGMVHHEGAIAMAETEQIRKRSEMRKLAQDIIKAQKGEIEQMNKWLGNQNNDCGNNILRVQSECSRHEPVNR